MLASLLNSVSERTFVLERFLSLGESCDAAATDPVSVLHAELQKLSLLEANLRRERTFRHCATITELYAIYESFTEAVLGIWLARLPKYKQLPDLPIQFQNAYRCGIARIIQDSGKRKYRHLSLDDIVKKYHDSLHGEPIWEIVAEALTTHERNLRRPEFEQLFHAADLKGVWASLEKSSSISSLVTEDGENRTLEQIILDLVNYRNEASHGSPDDILGVDSLRYWILFVKAFCDALALFVTHRVIHEEITHNPESVYGTVTETFSRNIIVVTCDRGTLSVGDSLYFLRDSDCTLARIESLQLDGVNTDSVAIDRPGLEVGIMTSVRVRDGAQVVHFSSGI